MRVVNTDTKYHSEKAPIKCLQKVERENKKIYLEAYLQQRLLDVKAAATLRRIASRLAKKWQQTYFRTCGYVNSRIATTLVWATHRCIRGSRVPAHKISAHRPQWEDGAGINLLRYARWDIPIPSEASNPSKPSDYRCAHFKLRLE